MASTTLLARGGRPIPPPPDPTAPISRKGLVAITTFDTKPEIPEAPKAKSDGRLVMGLNGNMVTVRGRKKQRNRLNRRIKRNVRIAA